MNIASRIAAGVLGGYAFTWGFIVFLVVFLWAFAARSVLRVWGVLAGGGALMAGAAWLVQRALL